MTKKIIQAPEEPVQHLDQQLSREALLMRRTCIKLLYIDGTGLWVATKRLEAERFSRPPPSKANQKKLKLTPETLQLLLDGVDLRGAKLRP